MLSAVRWFELLFALLPIKYLMKLFWFSDLFANAIALPMTALFLGTGNETPQVPSIMLERLCTSPTYGMWFPLDKRSISSTFPPMVVFPNFSNFYADWKKTLEAKGVQIRLNTEVTRVVKRGKDGVVVKIINRVPNTDIDNPTRTSAQEGLTRNTNPGSEERQEEYDELVLCLLYVIRPISGTRANILPRADSARRILGESASFAEKRILGSCKFSNDITVTHSDSDYMKKHYDTRYNAEQAVTTLSGIDYTDRCKKAESSFKPMYLVKTYPSDRTKLELCFDCSNYQGQFPEDLPFEKHVFQTIFLNKERDGHLWTIDEIDEKKIIRKDWWHQLCHSWTHYAFVVPWLWLIQGRRNTRFASSWTLVNAHEVACISGIAAAVSLGVEYPKDLERDTFAFLCFRLYYLFQYRRWYRRRAAKAGDGQDWASGLNGSVYRGPGVAKEEKSIWKEEKAAGRSV
jgi:hypothetical protein